MDLITMLDGKIELFIHYQSICIFYMNLQEQFEESRMDVQLIAGFLTSSTLFFDEMSVGENDPLYRILRGNSEIRMRIGDNIHGTLLLRDLYFDEKTYYELDALLKSIIARFESKYIKEIDTFATYGSLEFKGISDFIKDEVEKMKAHIYSSYLLQILGIAFNRKLFRKRTKDLMASIHIAYSVDSSSNDKMRVHNDRIRSEIDKYQISHITLARVVKQVNNEFKNIWRVFRVPLIPESPLLDKYIRTNTESDDDFEIIL